jgi:ABC-type tungstate transport system substrate-binding protein
MPIYSESFAAAFGLLASSDRDLMEILALSIKVSALPENLNLGISDVESLCIESDSHLGRIKHLAPVLSLSETLPYWALPTPKMGSNGPSWLG